MDLAPEYMRAFADGAREGTAIAPAMPLRSGDFVAQAVACAGIGTWHFDIATGVTTWDAAASEIFGYAPQPRSLLGLGPVHPEDRALVQEALKKSLQDGRGFNVQFRVVRTDGEVRWVHAASGVARETDGPPRYLAGIVSDVTARRVADEKLRQAEERHRLINQASSDLIYEWDVATGELTWNDTLANHFGYSPDNLTSISEFALLLHPDECTALQEGVAKVLKSDSTQFADTHRLKRGDGSYAEVQTTLHVIRDLDGKPVRVIGNLHDVSQRKKMDAALRESEAVNRSIVEASTDVIKLLDLGGRLLFMNGSGAKALDIDEQGIPLGSLWASLWPRRARSVVREAVATAAAGGVARFSEACPTRLGQNKWWDVVISPVLGSDGTPTKLVAISRDITERKEAAERLAWGASHDHLTALPNRAFFQEALSNSVARSRSSKDNLGLLLFDLDDFKQVNDTLGHDAGDAVLKTFATRIQEAMAGRATIARLGGDEFGALIENVANEDELVGHANAILQRMREPFVHAGRILDCHVTIGAALLSADDESADDLLKNADIALYVAKGSNRGSPTVFRPDHRGAMQQRQTMINLARMAISERRIVPFYQPKVALAEGRVHGFEALLRWRHPREGIQLPATISAAFEDLDVAAAISDQMIDQVISDMRSWLDQGLAFGHVAVNAAAAEFRRDNFAESVLERLERAQVPVKYFQLEVTETVFLGRGAEYVGRALKLLDDAGASIALDDFGTGYASLRHLKQFPVHVIKIDQSFVRNMDTDPDDAAIISAVLNLGRSLDIGVVAEGVEAAAHAQRLRELGCQFGQGFLYSAAVAAADVPVLLRSRWLAEASDAPAS